MGKITPKQSTLRMRSTCTTSGCAIIHSMHAGSLRYLKWPKSVVLGDGGVNMRVCAHVTNIAVLATRVCVALSTPLAHKEVLHHCLHAGTGTG